MIQWAPPRGRNFFLLEAGVEDKRTSTRHTIGLLPNLVPWRSTRFLGRHFSCSVAGEAEIEQLPCVMWDAIPLFPPHTCSPLEALPWSCNGCIPLKEDAVWDAIHDHLVRDGAAAFLTGCRTISFPFFSQDPIQLFSLSLSSSSSPWQLLKDGGEALQHHVVTLSFAWNKRDCK